MSKEIDNHNYIMIYHKLGGKASQTFNNKYMRIIRNADEVPGAVDDQTRSDIVDSLSHGHYYIVFYTEGDKLKELHVKGQQIIALEPLSMYNQAKSGQKKYKTFANTPARVGGKL